jgi:hypothetical protein
MTEFYKQLFRPYFERFKDVEKRLNHEDERQIGAIISTFKGGRREREKGENPGFDGR